MGDGRYYTYGQFFSVIFLTFLIIFVVISAMSSYYRNTNSKGSRYSTVIFTQLSMVVVLRFVEEVIVSMQTAKMLRFTQNILLIMAVVIFTYYLKICVIPIYQQNNHSQEHHKFWNGVVLAIALILFIVGACCDYTVFIKDYTFQYIMYTRTYGIILSMVNAILIANSYKIFKLKKTVNGAYKSRLLACIIFSMLSVPFIIYMIAILCKWSSVDYIEFLTLFLFALVVNFLTISFIPYAVTPIAFDKIKDMIMDYVFVTDVNDNIVYKNENMNEYLWFSNVSKVKENHLQDLFSGKVKHKLNKHGEPYIKVINNQQVCYFAYRVTTLESKKKYMGNIINISDITDLVELLNNLEEKKQKAEEANQQLSDDSEVVYYLEKEKEINTLLEKITTEQSESMNKIKLEIDYLIEHLGDENFEKAVDEVIELINRNLNEVRRAVTMYREYYHGGGEA